MARSSKKPRAKAKRGGGLPFEPDDLAFNRINALYLAHAADIAYHRAPGPAAAERLGLKAFAFRSKLTRARGFLGVCDTHAVLSFRGTDPLTLPNWMTNAVVRLVASSEYGGRVHHGYDFALSRAWAKLAAVLDEVEDKPLFLTGHSMGGALAVLAACRLAKLDRKPAAIYTYGAPRVGDLGFCSGYNLPTYRLVNRLDLVPELPLASAADLLPEGFRMKNEKLRARLERTAARRGPVYGHVPTLVYIDRDGAITPDAEIAPWNVEAVARAVATRGKSFFEGVTDHLIVNYIRSLEGLPPEPAPRLRRRTK